MDSGNSSSMQSSSGGGGGGGGVGGGGDDQEYDSRSLFLHNNIFSQGDPFNWPVRPDPNHNYLSFNGDFTASASTAATAQPPPPPPPPPDPKPAVQKNPKKRTRASRRAPTTVLTTDTSNFRAMVQEFTGIPDPPFSTASRRLDLISTAGSSMRLAAAFRPTTAQVIAGLGSVQPDPTFHSLLHQPIINQTHPPPNALFGNINMGLLGPESLSGGSGGMDPLGLGFGSTPNNNINNNNHNYLMNLSCGTMPTDDQANN